MWYRNLSGVTFHQKKQRYYAQPSVRVRGTTQLTGDAIGEVLNRAIHVGN